MSKSNSDQDRKDLGAIERRNNTSVKRNQFRGLNMRNLWYEFEKDLKIFFRGPNRGTIGLVLIFPIMFTLFMWLVFGRTYFAYPTAVVVEGFDSQQDLEAALRSGQLPETQKFIDYLDNYSLVQETIVHSDVVSVVYSQDAVMDKFTNLEVLVIVVIPDNFEDYISGARSGITREGPLNIRCLCANVNEDLLKNLYFGIERKVSKYYQMEFPNEIEVNYQYFNADPNKATFPRMWTIGSGGIVYSILTASFILGSAMVFLEKHTHMDSELIMISESNRGMNYLGKIFASATISTGINFPFSATVILGLLQMGVPVNLPGLIGIIFISNTFGSAFGVIIGVILKEQVYTFPVNVFIILPNVFLCGGFMDIQLFQDPLFTIVSFVPFTYIFTLVKYCILPGFIWNWLYFIGLLIYTVIFLIIGWRVYNRGMIKGWQQE